MYKKILISSLLLASLSITSSASEENKLGLAVGLSSDSTTLRLPIDIQSDFRIEPEFGLSYSNGDDVSRTNLTIGSGFYVMKQPTSKTNLYLGGKALIDYNSFDYDKGADDSTTQFKMGGVFGFEYLFDKSFSIGGEAGAYIGFGDTTTLNTQGVALLRFYL